MPSHSLNKQKFPLKFFIIVGIILVPILVTIMVCRPIIARYMSSSYMSVYKLPEAFRKEDIRSIIFNMMREPEYTFYFRALSEEDVPQVIDEVYHALDTHRGRSEHQKLLLEWQKSVEDMATLIDSLSFPEEMTAESHPELVVMLWKFLRKEFQTTIVGLCYKATYDEEFRLKWSAKSVKAAQLLREVFRQLEHP